MQVHHSNPCCGRGTVRLSVGTRRPTATRARSGARWRFLVGPGHHVACQIQNLILLRPQNQRTQDAVRRPDEVRDVRVDGRAHELLGKRALAQRVGGQHAHPANRQRRRVQGPLGVLRARGGLACAVEAVSCSVYKLGLLLHSHNTTRIHTGESSYNSMTAYAGEGMVGGCRGGSPSYSSTRLEAND